MPQMDGMQATRRIRDGGSDVLDHDVPIVALTAHAMAEDRDVCLFSYFLGFSPTDLVQLNHNLRRLI